MPIKGFIPLQTPQDLAAKLEHDLGRMKAEPTDAYAAFDFFVTAEHVLDWLYPDKANGKTKRQELRNQHEILQTVSHLASGAKHFDGLRKRHKAVVGQSFSDTGFSSTSFSTASFSHEAFQFAGITIKLTTGKSKCAVDLAKEVYDFWRERLTIRSS
ncbi:MAG: hypothetical protein WCE61_00540 [Candidatus Acidiferrum sp.]